MDRITHQTTDDHRIASDPHVTITTNPPDDIDVKEALRTSIKSKNKGLETSDCKGLGTSDCKGLGTSLVGTEQSTFQQYNNYNHSGSSDEEELDSCKEKEDKTAGNNVSY